MIGFPSKDTYKKYTKSEKRFYWGFAVFVLCMMLLMLAWKPYILPLLK